MEEQPGGLREVEEGEKSCGEVDSAPTQCRKKALIDMLQRQGRERYPRRGAKYESSKRV